MILFVARFKSSTKEILEFRIANVEAEELLYGRDTKLKELEMTIRKIFLGKGVNPYIFNIVSESDRSLDDFQSIVRHVKIGYGIYIRFHEEK